MNKLIYTLIICLTLSFTTIDNAYANTYTQKAPIIQNGNDANVTWPFWACLIMAIGYAPKFPGDSEWGI